MFPNTNKGLTAGDKSVRGTLRQRCLSFLPDQSPTRVQASNNAAMANPATHKLTDGESSRVAPPTAAALATKGTARVDGSSTVHGGTDGPLGVAVTLVVGWGVWLTDAVQVHGPVTERLPVPGVVCGRVPDDVLVRLGLAKRCGLCVCVCGHFAVGDDVGEELRVRARVGDSNVVPVRGPGWTAVPMTPRLQVPVCAALLVSGAVVVRLRVDVE